MCSSGRSVIPTGNVPAVISPPVGGGGGRQPRRFAGVFFFFQAEDGIRDIGVTGVQTCALPIFRSGELPCLVATSSLELGIDMGAVDLVLQVESPKSVTRGLQRIGRAGHNVGDTSKGRIFPKFRADLLECAVVAQRMREGLIETTVVPRNPLDVLAQQIVAIAASSEDPVPV